MQKQFLILSRNMAEHLDPSQHWATLGSIAMIRISSDPFRQHPHHNVFAGIVHFDFSDISEETYFRYLEQLQPGQEPKVHMITAKDADTIVEFATKHKDVTTFVVHCDAGVSRSAGVMMALCDTVFDRPDEGAHIATSHKYIPNITVYSYIIKAYERLTGIKLTYD